MVAGRAIRYQDANHDLMILTILRGAEVTGKAVISQSIADQISSNPLRFNYSQTSTSFRLSSLTRRGFIARVGGKGVSAEYYLTQKGIRKWDKITAPVNKGGESALRSLRRKGNQNAKEELVQDCVGTLRSNCIGTALYIVGMQHEDDKIEGLITPYKEYLEELERVLKPGVGLLVSWERTYYPNLFKNQIEIHHIGVIVSMDPILVAHRNGEGAVFEPNCRIDAAGRSFNHKEGIYNSFYVPKPLIIR